MINSDSIKELLELREYYEQEKANFIEQKEDFYQKKENIYDQVIENIKREVDNSPNNERLQKYLESTYITDFEFLYKAINDKFGNNLCGSLTIPRLLSLDDEVYQLALKYDILFRGDVEDKFYYHYDSNLPGPFFEEELIKDKMEKVKTLAYLDQLFKNSDNAVWYQGAYVVYHYVKSYLKEVLKEELPQTDNELIYKDFNQKLEIVLANLPDIATYLLDVREQIPNSRSALCNQILLRTARKKNISKVSPNQNIFAKGIAFGTTLDKLQAGNYEDAKSLIFLPHQRIFNKKY